MNDGRWAFNWVYCGCVDARFIYGLSRTYATFKDTRQDHPVGCDEKDAEVWKEYFAGLTTQRPLLAFALAIDFNQEPAQRAMEANRWTLVATGERGHDREINGKHVYARFYMKKFPKTGRVFASVRNTLPLSTNYSCSFDIKDHESHIGSELVPEFNTCYTAGTMVLTRVPVSKLPILKAPTSNFECIAKTDYAHYFLTNAVEIFVRAK
jgi:hypothetical protein